MKKLREYWLTQTVDKTPELAFESEEELIKNNWKKSLHVREVDAEREAAVMELVEALKGLDAKSCEDGDWVHFKNAMLNTSEMSNMARANIWNHIVEIKKALAKWEAVNK
jgi:hypothetical protein